MGPRLDQASLLPAPLLTFANSTVALQVTSAIAAFQSSLQALRGERIKTDIRVAALHQEQAMLAAALQQVRAQPCLNEPEQGNDPCSAFCACSAVLSWGQRSWWCLPSALLLREATKAPASASCLLRVKSIARC